MVFAMDNLASGNNTFDNLSNVAYVSFVRETFLYLLMSVISVSFHINNPYIGDIIGLSMKFILTLILCSQTQQICMPPYQWTDLFNSQYDCLMFGYEESKNKMQEIGREEVNKHSIYVKFYCTPQEVI
jgi:hypothetical protein